MSPDDIANVATYILEQLGEDVLTVPITVTPHLEPGRLVAILGPVPGAEGRAHLFVGPTDADEAAEALACARTMYEVATRGTMN